MLHNGIKLWEDSKQEHLCFIPRLKLIGVVRFYGVFGGVSLLERHVI